MSRLLGWVVLELTGQGWRLEHSGAPWASHAEAVNELDGCAEGGGTWALARVELEDRAAAMSASALLLAEASASTALDRDETHVVDDDPDQGVRCACGGPSLPGLVHNADACWWMQ